MLRWAYNRAISLKKTYSASILNVLASIRPNTPVEEHRQLAVPPRARSILVSKAMALAENVRFDSGVNSQNVTMSLLKMSQRSDIR